MRFHRYTALLLVFWLVWPQAAAAEVPPFPGGTELYLLQDGGTDPSAADNVLAISPYGAVQIELTGAELRALNGADRVNFDDMGLSIDSDGNLYFGEAFTDQLYVKPRDKPPQILTARDTLSATVQSGSVQLGMPAMGLDGFLYLVERSSDSILRIDPKTGAPAVFVTKDALEAVAGPVGLFIPLVVDAAGALYVVNRVNTGADQILKIAADGTPAVFTQDPALGTIRWLTRTANGDLLVAESEQDAIYRVSAAGQVSLYLSQEQLAASVGVAVSLSHSIAVDSQGNLYVLDNSPDRLLRYDSAGNGEVLVSEEQFQAATGGTLSGNLAIALGPPRRTLLPRVGGLLH